MLFIGLYQIKLYTAKNYANKGDALLNSGVYIVAQVSSEPIMDKENNDGICCINS